MEWFEGEVGKGERTQRDRSVQSPEMDIVQNVTIAAFRVSCEHEVVVAFVRVWYSEVRVIKLYKADYETCAPYQKLQCHTTA